MKLLITGASGFLGWNLSQIAPREWEVYGTYHTHPLEIPNVTLIKIDLTDFQSVSKLFSKIKPAAVIHTAASSSPNFCQTNPETSALINIEATLHLARLCAEANVDFVFTSTDLVFDGSNSPYKETDPVSPLSYYGEQKARAEREILALHPGSTICRMPLMFGTAPPTASSFIQPFIQTLKQGQELSLFIDEFRTPISGETAAKGLLLALKVPVTGLLHLGGKERISRYEFGCLMAEILELPGDKITSCSQADVPMAAPRAADVSLASSKAFALGYKPLSLREELMRIKQFL